LKAHAEEKLKFQQERHDAYLKEHADGIHAEWKGKHEEAEKRAEELLKEVETLAEAKKKVEEDHEILKPRADPV
jgi:hypothetical protein